MKHRTKKPSSARTVANVRNSVAAPTPATYTTITPSFPYRSTFFIVCIVILCVQNLMEAASRGDNLLSILRTAGALFLFLVGTLWVFLRSRSLRSEKQEMHLRQQEMEAMMDTLKGETAALKEEKSALGAEKAALKAEKAALEEEKATKTEALDGENDQQQEFITEADNQGLFIPYTLLEEEHQLSQLRTAQIEWKPETNSNDAKTMKYTVIEYDDREFHKAYRAFSTTARIDHQILLRPRLIMQDKLTNKWMLFYDEFTPISSWKELQVILNGEKKNIRSTVKTHLEAIAFAHQQGLVIGDLNTIEGYAIQDGRIKIKGMKKPSFLTDERLFTDFSDYTIFLKECVPNEMEDFQDFLDHLQRKIKGSKLAHRKFVECALKHPFTMTEYERVEEFSNIFRGVKHLTLPKASQIQKELGEKKPAEDYSMYVPWAAESSGNPLTGELLTAFKHEKSEWYNVQEIWHLVRLLRNTFEHNITIWNAAGVDQLIGTQFPGLLCKLTRKVYAKEDD